MGQGCVFLSGGGYTGLDTGVHKDPMAYCLETSCGNFRGNDIKVWGSGGGGGLGDRTEAVGV